MNKIIILFLLVTTNVYSKPIFIGDSLTYSLAVSAKNINPVDAFYLEGTGLSSDRLLDWQSYINEINFQGYDDIYISLGANDAIKKEEITNYVNMGVSFVEKIKNNSDNINITWIIPPVMKNKELESKLKNTRFAIYKICNNTKINCFNPNIILGDDFSFKFKEKQIRTSDGVHYTPQGADLIINNIFKGI
ncbi:SGNH/GDSL hydrolase family protein [Providencia alcalifaciens]|uniref:SGNH/GDSL hydrolase family protein n=1 Tax=Providencia alcalifaciens TaxID=126385 RepID=UPI0032DAF827